MSKLLPVLFLSLFALCCQATAAAAAAEADPKMHAAVENLVGSQNFEQLWPAMMKSAAANEVFGLERLFREAVDKTPAFTPVQRARAHEIIAETMPEVTADFHAVYRKMLVKETFREMGHAIYPKHYTVSEIEELTRFYGSKAYGQITALSMQAADESTRTGKNLLEVLPGYLRKMAKPEMQVVEQFGNSAIGRKTKRLEPVIGQERIAFLTERATPQLQALGQKYRKRLQTRFSKEFN